MARSRDRGPDSTPEMPSATPRDLHATTDIRFVIHEIGKISEAVGEMKKTIESQGVKIGRFEKYVVAVNTAVTVIVGVAIVLGAIASFIFDGKLSQLLSVVNKLNTP
ncbi:MAG: hypothetical protein NBV67_00270 [Tagaea sp.]|nr:hypothetical protein [Tagaea sp.]